MDKSPKPISAIAPFGLRMQPALKAALEERAKENARSLNAEIVDRLEASLSKEQSKNTNALPTLSIELDATGYPISWDEINVILRALLDDGGVKAVAMNTSVFTPELVSSQERERVSRELAAKLQKFIVKD